MEINKIDLKEEIKKARLKGKEICWDCKIYQEALKTKRLGSPIDIARCGNMLTNNDHYNVVVHALLSSDCTDFHKYKFKVGEDII